MTTEELEGLELPADANLMMNGVRRNVILRRTMGIMVWCELVPYGKQFGKPLGWWQHPRHVDLGHVEVDDPPWINRVQ